MGAAGWRVDGAIALAAILATACGPQSVESLESSRTRALASLERVSVVAPASVDRTRLERLGRELERRGRWKVEFVEQRSSAATGACLWIAAHDSPGIGELAQLNGIVFESTGAFWFGGERYGAPGDGVRLTLPDPERPQTLLQVFLAPSASQAAELVESLEPQTSPGWVAMRAGQVSGDSRGRVSTLAPPASAAGATPPPAVDDRGLSWRTPVGAPPALLESYRARVAAVRARVESWLGPADAPPRLEVFVWPDLDAFAAATGACELRARGFAAGQTHVLLAGEGLDDGGGGVARALAESLAGPPGEDWVLDAFELLASESWMGAPLERALALAAARPLSLDHVLRPEPRASPHRYQPLRALALRLALEGLDSAAVRATWRSGGFAERVDPSRFEREVAACAGAGAASFAARRERVLRESNALSGVHLTAPFDREGRRGLGYGSRACFEALRVLAGLGAGGVVLAPHAYLEGDERVAPLRAASEPFAASASDVALWLALVQARALGLKVVFAPQLWGSPSGSLAAARQGVDARESAELLAELSSMVEHYALLAELAGVDVLCVAERALGLARADLPVGSAARWPELVAAARASFAGALTYLALFDGEAHHFEWSEEFDLICVALVHDLTHPVFDGRRPTELGLDALLRSQLETLCEWAAPLKRPLWLMQVGYAPTTEAWLDPRAAQGGYDTTQQADLLRAFGRALAAQRSSGGAPAGVFFWNWSTDAEHGNAVDRSFTLQNRPAAELLADLLRRP